ncbi:MAG TPA: glucose-1-phosphate adenylyltransferase [Candidatus Desulfofervidus auxilii]|uniref:Glucose-1-phosphate adenylyltransferase n=1 Tax=Desulfofervidus auxilii TaxID=1621989 RepID=A0A7C0Y785_DESA2|nr:glucose-1-phosphate adenylyltransferase [Candidatus Desulfofervidus auxilii]
MLKILAMVLAGGKGERLYPLTAHRTKPAVHFGGIYRLIDFVLSNLVNSGIYSIYVLTQYKAQSLLRHLQLGWVGAYPMDSFFILPVPAQMRLRESWYLGTADAIYQNTYLIKQFKPDLVLIFGADHVYFMDVRQMIDYHLEKNAEVTVATIPYPISECYQFGVVVVDENWQIKKFQEKTSNPIAMPGDPNKGLVSMGNYVFNTDVLLEELEIDAEDKDSSHDFGKDVLPRICQTRRVFAYDFCQNKVPGLEKQPTYWRDVGTIISYYEANMDLKNPLPKLNLYNPKWPVRSVKYHDPPAKVVVDAEGRIGHLENSLIAGGSIVSGGWVRDSVIGRNVFVGSRALVEESVLIGDVIVEEGAQIRRTIVDEGNIIRRGERIGYDLEKDAERFYLDLTSGIVVVPKKTV